MTDDMIDTLTMTAEIVASYLGNEHSRIQANEIPELIRSIRATLSESDASPSPASTEGGFPKASKRDITKSITPDGLISFVDGKAYKTLKRHLTTHGMSHADYKARYGLPNDYPSVAANYSAARSVMAKTLGLGALGRKLKAPEPASAKKGPGRVKKAAPAG